MTFGRLWQLLNMNISLKFFKSLITQIIWSKLSNNWNYFFFVILCGVAQGDSPSGLIFILALETLLWRLALDVSILHPVLETGEKIDSSNSSNADDVFILIDREPKIFINCKTILDDFSKHSGLIINIDKTQIYYLLMFHKI